MRYLDICAGISASTVAWKPLGWQAAAYSEIEAAPRAILAHHYPDVPLHGDFTTIGADDYGAIDVLVGGTPCQDFSVAGLRAGLDGHRGNLTLEYVRLADRKRPRWLAWENVPGILSIDGGRAFGAFLGGLAELGYGFAYRVLDAQHFGVPQRRRRVILVGHIGDWRRAAAVLFERHSLSGHPAPRREAGEGVARPIAAGSPSGSGYRNDADTADNLISHPLRAQSQPSHRADSDTYIPVSSHCLNAGGMGRQDYETETLIVDTLTSNGDAHSGFRDEKGLIPLSFMENVRAELRISEQTDALTRGGGKPGQGYAAALLGSAVRRLTPRECERLQGFPDDYTLVPHRGKPMADGPRYKALGNSMAVPVMRWIGERIAAVDALSARSLAA